jgi:hypothetical protein
MQPSPVYDKCNQQAMATVAPLKPNIKSLVTTVTTTAASFLFPGATWFKAVRGVVVGQLSRLVVKAEIYNGQFAACMQSLLGHRDPVKTCHLELACNTPALCDSCT